MVSLPLREPQGRELVESVEPLCARFKCSFANYLNHLNLHRYRLTGLDAPSFNHQFVVGENESILNGLEPALGVGLLGFRLLGLDRTVILFNVAVNLRARRLRMQAA